MDDQLTPSTAPAEDGQERASKNQNKKKTPASAYVILAVFLIGGFLALYAEWNDIWWASNEFKPGPEIALEVSDIRLAANMIGQTAAGTVTNGTGNKFKNVQVVVNLYDSGGNLVGTANETRETLAPGQSWDFTAMILVDAVATLELKEVTGYLDEDKD
ncbi:MAG: hypothetical protein IH945_11765 [Armatimonadetes bacterium]|nr:hypothetical protein [Armatimonadota bacterium]